MAPSELAREVLAEADVAYLSAHTSEGVLVQRALNPVLEGDWLLFHGSHAGEKTELVGEAIVSAHRVVADIPSYFIDAELACPATTYYESGEARGQLEVIHDAGLKDAMLMALMRKFQPEGGYNAIDSSTALYKKQVLATRVFGFRMTSLLGKMSLGQDRPKERVEKVIRGLWKRGAPHDLPAIERILGSSPQARPDFLRGPADSSQIQGAEAETRFVVHPTRELALAHAELLAPEYWRTGSTRDEMAQAALGSAAWVGLVDNNEELIAAGRAVSDGIWAGQICDVVVRSEARGRGLGRALMKLLLDHPKVRSVHRLRLGTRDAMTFYENLGFRNASEMPLPFAHTEMVRV